MDSNDEVERRGASPASTEGTLSQSSTPLLGPNEDATRDRSNRLLGLYARPRVPYPALSSSRSTLRNVASSTGAAPTAWRSV
jgi:hypothetical protein